MRHAGWVGRSFPLDGSAAGTVLLGQTPEQGWTSIASGIEPDVTAVAAPISGPGGVVAALSIVGPTYRLDQDAVGTFGPLLTRLAHGLSEHIGVRRKPPFRLKPVPVARVRANRPTRNTRSRT